MTTARTRNLCLTSSLAILLTLGGSMPAAEAAFHFWQVKEVFTNASGSVQFVEMFDTNAGETLMAGKTITANSGGNIKTFTFPSDLSKPTNNHSLLIATTGFGSLAGGVTPDFTFSQGGVTEPFFISTASSFTITFTGSGSSMSFTGAQLPKNGVDSINRPTTIAVNSPTNLDGNTGSVNLAPTGDYNGDHSVNAADYAVWRKTFNATVSPAGNGADGDSSGTIGAGDYTYWRARFGNAAAAGAIFGDTVPEPTIATLQLSWVMLLAGRFRKRSATVEQINV